jgi:hypothetical protein
MPNIKWNPAHINFLIQNAPKMKDEDIMNELNRMGGGPFTLKSVRMKRQRLNIIKVAGRGKFKLRGRHSGENPTPPTI